MSRILLLVLFLIWMAGPTPQSTHDLWPNIVLFFSFYVMLVLLLGLWSRTLARRVAAENFHRSLRLFNKVMFAARVMVPVWLTVGVWCLGWGGVVAVLGMGMYRSTVGMLLVTLPAFATWMGLWWSQYPAERALREQNLLVELDNDLPLYRPPPFRHYFFSNFRLQILFTLVPVVLIVLVKDALMLATGQPIGAQQPSEMGIKIEAACSITAVAVVFVFAPLVLRRVLNTTPMPESPLKTKLDALCVRAGVRYRHILIWNTNNHVGNAAVMGVIPWVRYVLLSDVLLEQMNEEEIQAVFAHELGHIVHRHMIWYAIYFVAAMLLGSVTLYLLSPLLDAHLHIQTEAIAVPLGFALAVILFGALSRRCERQADVYAARTMEMLKAEEPLVSQGLLVARQLVTVGAGALQVERLSGQMAVGRHGAEQFSSALSRVATINNIPITPRIGSPRGFRNCVTYWVDGTVELANNWLHGSIASRMQYLQDLSADPRRTSDFDRTMIWLYCGILFVLFVSAVSLASIWANDKSKPENPCTPQSSSAQIFVISQS